MTDKDATGQTRREFFRKAGLGAGAVGAAAVTLAAGTAEAAAEPVDAPAGKGYRETAHVKTFYDTARF